MTATSLIASTSASPPPTSPAMREAWQAAQEFEAVFLGQMLHAMMPVDEASAGLAGGRTEGTYRELMNEHLGRAIARSGGIGIAPAIYREMLRQQETGGA
jgi:Rod binding domain-containing protein